MTIEVSEKIRVRNPTKELLKWCEENLVLDNPDYYKLQRLGKWTGRTPSKIYLYEKVFDELLIPFGCLRDVWKICNGADFLSKIAEIRPTRYVGSIKPYQYQEKAIQASLETKNGVLVMPCGSGKTQSGLEVIARVGGKALWLTHTQDLLNQSKRRAENVLSGVKLGTITAGKVNIGEHITFATVQTMSKLNLSAYRNLWDIIIVDECQHCAGSPTRVTQFYKVMSNLSARYKIGLTATPKRSDGLERAMFALLGNVIHEVRREEVEHTTCPIKVLQLHTGWKPTSEVLLWDGTIDYNKLVESLIGNADRFYSIVNRILCLGGSALVLGNRVEYLKKMADVVGESKKVLCISGMGQSKKAKAERKEALRQLDCGDLDVVFGTYQLAKEGLDVPNLKYVVLATPEKDETTVIQSIGRVGRKAEGKKCGIVLDFVDDFGMYKGWAKHRERHYKKIDAKIY